MKVTYNFDYTQWTYIFHFKYKNSPETLIMIDDDGFDWKYRPTDLYNALMLRDSKIIKDF